MNRMLDIKKLDFFSTKTSPRKTSKYIYDWYGFEILPLKSFQISAKRYLSLLHETFPTKKYNSDIHLVFLAMPIQN